MYKYSKKIGFISTVVLAVVLIPEFALARAGGGSSSGGGGILTLILLPFLLIYSAILTHQVSKKNKEAKELLERLSQYDSSWDINNIKHNIETAFFKIQEAWMERNQDMARDYLSDSLYEKHKMQTDTMIKNNEKNILRNISLKESKVVQVADYTDDSKDMMWVYIVGSMIDYTINDQTGKLISGEEDEQKAFSELWKFIRGPKGWVLDEIDQTVTIEDVKGFESFSK
ncbi:MAG: Tim44 domain-containing protein [Ignavibacteriales bacterium]